MEKLFVVCYGSASQDDHGNSHAYSDVHGVYASKESALKGLVECKDECYNEMVNDPEDYEERSIQVYGSEAEEYFEIDYDFCGTPCEIYIKIVEKELNV